MRPLVGRQVSVVGGHVVTLVTGQQLVVPARLRMRTDLVVEELDGVRGGELTALAHSVSNSRLALFY